jgi:hypothetical protein
MVVLNEVHSELKRVVLDLIDLNLLNVDLFYFVDLVLGEQYLFFHLGDPVC